MTEVENIINNAKIKKIEDRLSFFENHRKEVVQDMKIMLDKKIIQSIDIKHQALQLATLSTTIYELKTVLMELKK